MSLRVQIQQWVVRLNLERGVTKENMKLNLSLLDQDKNKTNVVISW